MLRFALLSVALLTCRAIAQTQDEKTKDVFTLQGPAHSLAFSPDGKLLAVGDRSGAIYLWKLPERTTGMPINAHTETVQSLSFSADGKTLLSASHNKLVKLYDVESRELKQTLKHAEAVWSAGFNSKGTLIATGGDDRKVRLWQAADGKLLKEVGDGITAIRMLEFSPDDRTLAVVGAPTMGEPKVLLFNVVASGLKAGLAGHTGTIDCLSYSADGRTLATGGSDKTIRLWDGLSSKAGKVLAGHGGTVSAIAFAKGGKTLVSASADRNLRLWDLASGKSVAVLWGHTSAIQCLAVSPDGTTAVSGDAGGDLRFWDLAKARSDPNAYQRAGEEKANLAAHLGYSVSAIDLVPPGKSLVSLGSEGKVRTWELATRKLLRELDLEPSPTAKTIAVSPDGKLLAVLKPGVHIEIRDSTSGKLLRPLVRKDAAPPAKDAPPIPIQDFFFTAKGDLLIAAVEHRIVGWDPKTGAEKFTWIGDDKQVVTLLPLPDGKRLVSGGENGQVKVWHLGQAKPALVLFAHRVPVSALTVTPDSKTLATVAAGEPIKTWDLESGKNLKLLENQALIDTMLFWDNGDTLLTGGAQGGIQVWDVAGSRVKQALRGHGAELTGLLRGPDATTLISASGDGTIKFWDMKKP